MRVASLSPGVERAEAYFTGRGFSPHRHDTYALGCTIHGVQAFRYRGAERMCVPGTMFVLHPDETHDGRAGTDEGFAYRGIYVDPARIAAALGPAGLGHGHPLPFAHAGVSDDPRLWAALLPALQDLDQPLESLQRDQIVLDIADALAALDSSFPRRSAPAKHGRAIKIARDLLASDVEEAITGADLEAATGISRFALARQFRACLGTSPWRYRILRRLDRARRLIEGGTSLSEAAAAAGFADQSHLTRHFSRAYGITPGRWAAFHRQGRGVSGQISSAIITAFRE